MLTPFTKNTFHSQTQGHLHILHSIYSDGALYCTVKEYSTLLILHPVRGKLGRVPFTKETVGIEIVSAKQRLESARKSGFIVTAVSPAVTQTAYLCLITEAVYLCGEIVRFFLCVSGLPLMMPSA